MHWIILTGLYDYGTIISDFVVAYLSLQTNSTERLVYDYGEIK